MDYDNSRRRDKGNNLLGWGIFAIFAVVLIGVGTALYYADRQTPRAEERISQVLENPGEYAGEEVTLVGDVEQVHGSRAISIDAPEPFSDELLVISRQPLEPIGGSGDEDYLFRVDDRVSVSGVIRSFNVREFEEELGADLVDEEFAAWEGRPAIIADTVNYER